jgi:hypothetical protein
MQTTTVGTKPQPPLARRIVLAGASEYFKTRILRWESDRWSQCGTDGKLVLVEECEEGEMDAAMAVVRLMYEAVLPPGLHALQVAQVRAACELCCFHKCTRLQLRFELVLVLADVPRG